jgi:hypothetical protein
VVLSLAIPGDLDGTFDAGQGGGKARFQQTTGGDPCHDFAREFHTVIQDEVIHRAGSKGLFQAVISTAPPTEGCFESI